MKHLNAAHVGVPIIGALREQLVAGGRMVCAADGCGNLRLATGQCKWCWQPAPRQAIGPGNTVRWVPAAAARAARREQGAATGGQRVAVVVMPFLHGEVVSRLG